MPEEQCPNCGKKRIKIDTGVRFLHGEAISEWWCGCQEERLRNAINEKKAILEARLKLWNKANA